MNLLLVDDHSLFRQGLKFLLSDLDQQLTFFEASDCKQAPPLLHQESFDLILLDLHMPGSEQLDALQLVTAAAPGILIAVLSGTDDPSLIRAAIEAGASGFVPKSTSPEILVAALRLILAGGIYLPANALDHAGAKGSPVLETTAHPSSAKQLSARQAAVLLLAVRGQANKLIAGELGIAEGTVKAHLSSAYKVLGVSNRTEAVFAAARLGLTISPLLPA